MNRALQLAKDILRTGSFKLRSPKWPGLCKRLEKSPDFKGCAACGSMKEVEWHHIVSFHEQPELELEVSNLIPLCMDRQPGGTRRECHLFFGHLPLGAEKPNWKTNNPLVRVEAAKQLARLAAQRAKHEARKNQIFTKP